MIQFLQDPSPKLSNFYGRFPNHKLVKSCKNLVLGVMNFI